MEKMELSSPGANSYKFYNKLVGKFANPGERVVKLPINHPVFIWEQAQGNNIAVTEVWQQEFGGCMVVWLLLIEFNGSKKGNYTFQTPQLEILKWDI